MSFALSLIVLAATWRVVGVHAPALSNFAPLMALTFCGAVYFRDRRMWLIPFAALTLSDLYIDHHYATTSPYGWPLADMVIRALCFVAALGIGAAVAKRKNWASLFGGVFGASVLFYLVTNTASWLSDPAYAHNFAGWWQALTIGHPEFPSTLSFYRNTLASDLLFTGLFVTVMEFAAAKRGESSLLAKRATA